MNRGLFIVTDADETEAQLLDEAAAVSTCSGASLVILRLLVPEDLESVEDVELTSDIDRRDYEDPADRQFEEETEAFVRETLDDAGVASEIVVRVKPEGDRAAAILDVAEEYDCDHVFLVGQRRSPTGKALFGDLTQEIVLNFDGTITLSME
ncbi:universal stress protein [Halorhabdus amylolytica]|uniref:universal stress protein n=1 Tax=Halorhabdus amylolytica TaxID=2559573 RepID=UPI0010A99FFF|nr:universal stress protein [Halorhabdus amylolytica]